MTGVLAIQGDFDKHVEALEKTGLASDKIELVRTLDSLKNVDRLIIPGGESTTVGMLLDRYGLGTEINNRAKCGMPIWGTCMGMILMAKKVVGSAQYSIDVIDITVRRNAFGRQIHSFTDIVQVEGISADVTGAFIRAPIITELGKDVEKFAEYKGKIVGARKGKIITTSFHPELTDDLRLHQLFLSL